MAPSLWSAAPSPSSPPMWRATAQRPLARIIVDPPQCESLLRSHFDMAALHISIDPVACDAYGYCAELLPELITLDEWGYPIVDGRPIPPELGVLAAKAARDSPRRALLVGALP